MVGITRSKVICVSYCFLKSIFIMFTRISPGCFIELHFFGQLCENIPDRTSSIITKHEAFHHVHQPATHSKKLRFKLENQGSTALWVGSKIPEYSRSSFPLIASQQVAGLKQNLTSKSKSHATHPLHREAKTKVKVSNSSTWERLQL